jgi:hypothetical protein
LLVKTIISTNRFAACNSSPDLYIQGNKIDAIDASTESSLLELEHFTASRVAPVRFWQGIQHQCEEAEVLSIDLGLGVISKAMHNVIEFTVKS